jgi:DNA-binding transcriptional LysR family regulator
MHFVCMLEVHLMQSQTTPWLRNFDLNLLLPLHALLVERSVTRAAKRHRLSAPAMSRALGRLREHLEDPLLIPSGRSFVLTSRAEKVLPEVEALLNRMGRALAPEAPFVQSEISDTFRLRCSDYVMEVMGPQLDQAMLQDAPDAKLFVRLNLPSDLEDLRAGDADVAVGVYGSLAPGLQVRELFRERLVCIVRKDHPTIRRRLTLTRYLQSNHVLTAPRGRPGSRIDTLLARQGRARRVLRTVPFFSSAIELVVASNCVLTLPERMADAAVARHDLQKFSCPVEVPSYPVRMVWHDRTEGDRAQAWFRGKVLQAAEASAR